MKKKAYIPAAKEGMKALACLIELFKARYTFCIAKSMNLSESKSVFWGKIIHKENRKGGGIDGFPDPNYLQNVISTCRALGISCDEQEMIDTLVNENNCLKVSLVKDKDKEGEFLDKPKCKMVYNG